MKRALFVENENAALPLSKEETQKISLLGFSSYYPVQGGDLEVLSVKIRERMQIR